MWAHFRRSAPETGLSAPIFAPQKFRSYPLRGLWALALVEGA
jgi:hypothetical protein